jgi:hypothetical protein
MISAVNNENKWWGYNLLSVSSLCTGGRSGKTPKLSNFAGRVILLSSERIDCPFTVP